MNFKINDSRQDQVCFIIDAITRSGADTRKYYTFTVFFYWLIRNNTERISIHFDFIWIIGYDLLFDNDIYVDLPLQLHMQSSKTHDVLTWIQPFVGWVKTSICELLSFKQVERVNCNSRVQRIIAWNCLKTIMFKCRLNTNLNMWNLHRI